MYIRELRVDGFGALRDVSVCFDKPVTVVCGPNEAGKSTLIRFLRSMLYGFPTRKEPVERGEPVHGGRHGGSIVVRTRDGRELLAERYADAGGAGRRTAGGLTVRDDRGLELGWSQQEWERQVLGGVSERLFRQLFAMSLDELHELMTLQGEEVGNFLYHSGLAGGAALADARRKLAAEMDRLYRPKGSTQEMNRLLASIKEAEAELRQSRAGLGVYREITEELDRVRRRLDERERTLPALAARAAELRVAVEKREMWLKLQLLTAEERELSLGLADPQAPLLPEEAQAEWTACLRRRQEALDRLEKAAQKVRDLRMEREALKWDERLLEHADELDKLEALREQAVARQEEREAAAGELRLLDEATFELMNRLGPDWTEADLHAFCAIPSEREPLRRLQSAWSESERKLERLEADAGRLRRQREALLSEMEAAAGKKPPGEQTAEEAFGPWRPGSRETLQEAWNALEDEYRRLERTISFTAAPVSAADGRRSAARSDRPAAGRSRLLFTAAAGSMLMALALLLGEAFGDFRAQPAALYAAAAVCVAMAVAYGGAGWARKRADASQPEAAAKPQTAKVEEARKRVRERLRGLLEQPERAAAALLGDPWTGEPAGADEAWRQLRHAVQAKLSAMEREERERERAREWQSRLAQLEREREALEAAVQEEKARSGEWMTEWSGWLRRYKLPASLTPDSVPELLSLAEQALTACRRQARAKERLAALDQFQAAFREAAAALFAVCPPPASLESDPAVAVSWLYRRAGEQKSVRDEAARAELRLRDAEAAELEAGQALEETEREMERIIRQAGEPDEASYERRLRIDERLRALRREKAEMELRLYAGRTPQAAEALCRLLERHDEGALAALLEQAEQSLLEAERERNELLDKRGRLSQEMERLRVEAEEEDRRMRLSELEAKLERLTERYAVLAICDKLLEETKAVFEEERQPEVMRLASRYFAEMTGGAYTRIVVPGGTPSVFAETSGRRVTDSAFLSRGTQEQLYLAMRFALAEAASKETPLPLLLDDLFVHFDEDRLRRTVPVLGEISEARQVLLFTCHRHVAEAVRKALPSAAILNWEGREADRSEAFGRGRS